VTSKEIKQFLKGYDSDLIFMFTRLGLLEEVAATARDVVEFASESYVKKLQKALDALEDTKVFPISADK